MEIHKLTILHDNYFTIVTQNGLGELGCLDGLAYDEMLGIVARLFCPVDSQGGPVRQLHRPLFLTPPAKES